jgi:NADPH:quinone reductase-like Zn-dependent oxidoreductase
VVGLTAYQGLIGYDIVKPGERIFINGGSSSVGSVAVQIAKKVAGAVVGASCSAANEEMVRKLGADEVCAAAAVFVTPMYDRIPQLAGHPQVFNYKASPLPDQLAAKPAYSSVFDCIGTQSLYTSSPRFLSPDGEYITTSADMHGQSTLQAAKTTLEVAANMFRPKWAGGTPREFKIFMMVYKRNELEDLVRWCAEGASCGVHFGAR